MKKILTATAVILAIAAAAFYWDYVTRPQVIESALPAGPAYYVKYLNAGVQLEEFRTSRLYKNVEGIDIAMLLEKSGMNKEQAEKIGLKKTEITEFFNSLPFEMYSIRKRL